MSDQSDDDLLHAYFVLIESGNKNEGGCGWVSTTLFILFLVLIYFIIK